MNIGSLIVRVGADLGDLTRGLKEAQDGIRSAGERMGQMGRTLSTQVTLPLVAAGGAMLKMAGDFQSSMNRVSALSGATADEFRALEEQAKQLGRTTQFSASQAGDAMGFLAMAGFNASEILGAMPSTLQLAAAAQLDLATAADITSNILTGYGMKVDELGHANDVLVKAFTSANTDLQQLGEAMTYAGPIAAGLGIEFEEAAAAIGLFGNAGIQGSMAGTSLRGALTRLAKPTAEVSGTLAALGVSTQDSAGNMLPLVDIVRQLEESGASAADMMALFGQRAGPAMMALVEQGSGALADFTAELRGAGGTAERIADVQMEGLNGAMKELKSAMEGLAIAVAQSGLLESFTGLVKVFTGVFQRLSEANPTLMRFATNLAGLVVTIGPILMIGSKLIAMFAALNPVVLGVTAAVVGLAAVWTVWGDDIKRIVTDTVGAIREQFARLTAIFDRVKDGVSSVTGAFRGMWDKVVGNSYVPDMVDGIAEHFGRLHAEMVTPAAAATAEVEGLFERMADRSLKRLAELSERQRQFALAGGSLDFVTPRSPAPGADASSSAGVLSQAFAALSTQATSLLASFGPLAIAAAVLKPVFDGFREAIGESLERLIEPLREVGRVIGEIVTPVLDALAEPLAALGQLIAATLEPTRAIVKIIVAYFTPALRSISSVLRVVNTAFSYVAEALGWFVRAVGKAADALVPDWLPWIGGTGKGLQETGQEMIDNARAMRDHTDIVKGSGDAIQRLTSSLSNVPAIFDHLTRRRDASMGVGSGLPGGQPNLPGRRPPVPATGGGGVTVNLYNPPAEIDVERTARQVTSSIVRQLGRGGVTELSLALDPR